MTVQIKPQPQPPAQPKRGDTAIAVVESLNQEGEGVAHVDGKAVFIQGALPGEEVLFRYHNKRKTYDTGAAQEILLPSPDRIAPRCPHFGVCGGCSLQHFEPHAQLAAKQQILLDSLKHIGKVAPEKILPPLAGPVWHYRRKARLGARLVPKKGGVLVGFREKGRSFITSLTRCEVLDEKISALLPALHALIASLSGPDRVPQIEVAVGDDVAGLVFRHLDPLTDADRERLSAFGRAHDLRIYLQPGDPRSISVLWPPGDPAWLHYALPEFGLRLRFGPSDFIQVNGPLNQAMTRRALELLDPQPHERVLDLFCGLGNFTLPLATKAGFVLGVEGSAELVEKGRENAALNNLSNVEFRQVDLYQASETPAGLWPEGRWDKLLLDPPRTGAMEIIRSLPADGPARILYISCYPATLARDSEFLVHHAGYRLAAAGVMDMFPHTTHVESIALFEKR